MNATEVLDSCHLKMIQALDDLPDEEWDVPGVCGNWSVKDIVAHLASYEYLLIDTLNTALGNEATSRLTHFVEHRDRFNAEEVAKRRYDTAQHVLDEYNDAQVESISLLERIPSETLQKVGIVPALGEQRSPNDLVNIVSKHTNEHRAHIEAFRNREAK